MMIRRRLTIACLLGAVTAMAAAAVDAQTAPPSLISLAPYATGTPLKPIDFSVSRTALGLSYDQAKALQVAGVVRTAVDHPFGRDGGPVGSVGFLCGLPPNAYDEGATSVRGYDPQGRFLGAKLSIPFR